MSILVQISQPIYSTKEKELKIGLSFRKGSKSYTSLVRIDFSSLLPYANVASKKSLDFFLIAACVYGIDRFIQRRPNSVDGWSRDIKTSFPVSDHTKWINSAPLLQDTLSFLSGDYWEVDFYNLSLNLPELEGENDDSTYAQVNLFSGGLDSLIGAIDFLTNNPSQSLLLASHNDRHIKSKPEQIALFNELSVVFSDRIKQVPSVNVFLADTNAPYEKTFRSRSLLFIGIALLIAQPNNLHICVPENGSVSLNFPLSPSRRSACSTRTTHPTLISGVNDILHSLSIISRINNPYEFKTKGEMVNECADKPLLQRIVSLSNSCGKKGHTVNWDIRNATHCGVCMPCTYRQASLLSLTDTTTYGNSINKAGLFKHKQGQDQGALLEIINSNLGNEQIKDELIINGLRNLEQLDDYVDVVSKTITELENWIKAKGNTQVLLKAGLSND